MKPTYNCTHFVYFNLEQKLKKKNKMKNKMNITIFDVLKIFS